MKSGFKDPIKIKNQSPKNKPEGYTSFWNNGQPKYDERSSCFVNAGTHYGVGHNQPVGSKEHNPHYAVPTGRIDTMRIDEAG